MTKTFARTIIIIAVIFMDILTGMEFDLFVPSFPEIQQQFSLTPFWVETLLSVNFIGYCLSLFFIGTIADHYGRKPVILLGLTTFILGSIICLLSHTFNIFLVGRFLQGVGIASPAILSFLIIADSYPVKKQQFLLAMLNGSMNIAAALGPVIGSYITFYFHWQGNFIALLLLGLITLAMTLIFIPNYQLPQHKEKFSFRGYIAIFQSKPLMLLIIYFFIMYTPYWIFIGMSPLLYMKALAVSLKHFGYYQGVLALVFALGSLIFGFLIKQYDQKKMLSISNQIFILSIFSTGLVTLIDSHYALWITLAFLPFVIGQIAPSTILYPLCLEIMPHAKARLTAIIQGGRLIVSALSLQVAGYFYTGSFKNIGIIIIVFIFLSIVIQFIITNNRAIIKRV